LEDSDDRQSYTVTYGKIGTVGAVKTKALNTPEMCQKEAEKLIDSKLKKGYVHEDDSAHVIKENTMTESKFWELLEKCKEHGDNAEEQMEWLVTKLSKRPVKDIVTFDYMFNKHYNNSYTSNLWAAAYIIMGGCSDDSFDYFRAWILYLGKEAYERAIEDPESLLPYLKVVEEQDEVPQLDEMLFIGSMAYEEKTGEDDEEYYKLYEQLVDKDITQKEIELDWDEKDEEGLRNKFPLLWEAYGENPME
jgi:predicted DNA-binding WGR domain protein